MVLKPFLLEEERELTCRGNYALLEGRITQVTADMGEGSWNLEEENVGALIFFALNLPSTAFPFSVLLPLSLVANCLSSQEGV